MLRWILTLLLLTTLVFTGCTNSDKDDPDTVAESSEDDFEDADFVDDEDEESSDLSDSDEEDSNEDFEDTDSSEDVAGDEGDDFEEDSGEETEATETADAVDEGDDFDEGDFIDDAGEEEKTAAADEEDLGDEFENESTEETAALPDESIAQNPESAPDEAAPPQDDDQFQDVALNNQEFEAPKEEAPAPKKTYVPVQKIKSEPFQRAGQNLNTVYMARPGDDISSISEKIYGDDRSKDLLAANPHLKRGVKVGDKVYYESPNRPNDQSSLLTAFEDSNVPSETYVSKPGENIRGISQELLGDSRSWMEIWATNPDIDSKWALSPGTEIRYWPKEAELGTGGPNLGSGSETGAGVDNFADNSDVAPAPQDNQAANNFPQETETAPAPAPTPTPAPPIPTPSAQVETVPAPTPAPTLMPTPTPEPAQQVAQADTIPPPPPPPPKPRKRVRKKKKKAQKSMLDSILGGGGSSENLLLIAGVLVIVMAGSLVFIRRRRQSKKIEFSETDMSE